jgi:hypothetical protein
VERRPDIVQFKAVFYVKNDRAMHEEIEINIVTLNGKPFRGSLV